MKKLYSFFLLVIFSSLVYGQKFDPQNISGDFIGLHCVGNTNSKISPVSKKYDEYILLNSKDKVGLKWRGSGKGEFIPLEGSWSFKESSIFGMGVNINTESKRGTLFTFKLNRLNGVFEESYSVSVNDLSLIEDESSGKCVRVNKFPKPIL